MESGFDLVELQHKHLPSVTQEKIRAYEQILKRNSDDSNFPFWDIIVLSSGDEDQKKSYKQQIEHKKSRNEIPGFVKYIVICDPPGAKIGNGGATMHVLEQLKEEVDSEELEKAKVMLLHAGGYSQRLPNVSVIGKIFMPLPCGAPMFHMLDAMLVMYIDLPARMNPGVFLTASDIILLYNGKGEWDMKQPGITAIAHPAGLEVATTHGVFVLDQIEKILDKYKEDLELPSTMGEVRCFLHKVAKARMKEAGARIPGTDQVYVDVGYYFDWPTAEKLIQFYKEHKPLQCEIDAYGDFLQALGPDASSEYCRNSANVTFVTEDLIEMREKVFDALKGVDLRVVIFNQAQFNHVGTTLEYLEHLFSNLTLIDSFGFKTETMVAEMGMMSEDDQLNEEVEEVELNSKRIKTSFEDCRLMYSILKDRASVSIGKGTVVEYCILEANVTIGNKSIVSNLHLPSGTSVPDSSFLHTIPLAIEGRTCFATFAFDICDSMKASVSRDNLKKLQYCKRDMGEVMEILFDGVDIGQVIPDSSVKCSLWNSKLFPVFSTREESAQHSVRMIQKMRGMECSKDVNISSGNQLMSVADMLKIKSVSSVLENHNSIMERVTSN